MKTLTSSAPRHTFRNRPGKALINPLLGMIVAAFFVALCGAATQAQTADSVCRRNGFQQNRANLNGLWELSFSAGTTRHVTSLNISGNRGNSVTEYYDSRLRRKRRVRQTHYLCQSKYGVVILGYNPTDIDNGQSGSDLTYSADNFVISQQPDGTVVAFNLDDSGATSEIDIRFVR